jgi:hypothetical protein
MSATLKPGILAFAMRSGITLSSAAITSGRVRPGVVVGSPAMASETRKMNRKERTRQGRLAWVGFISHLLKALLRGAYL